MISAARLQRFARERGLRFALEPAARRTPSVFRRYDRQRLVGWFGVPGPTGFEVGQSIRTLTLGTDDEYADTSRITWAAFALRAGPTGAHVLRTVAAVAPYGWHAEIDGHELVLWTLRLRHTRLNSARLWEWLNRAHDELTPLLARPEQTSESADRRRRGIRLAIGS